MVDTQRAATDAMELNHARLLALVEGEHTRRTLGQNGVLAYAKTPEQRVEEDVQALCDRLGLTREQAIAWIKSNLPTREAS